jgi:hypothetical protein
MNHDILLQGRRRGVSVAVAITLAIAGTVALVGVQGAPAGATAPVVQACSPSYIGVPGSGQTAATSVEMYTVGQWLSVAANKAGLPLRNNTNLSYPAVPWSQYVTVKHGTQVDWNGLGKSEATGEQNLTNLINTYRGQAAAAGCPNAPMLLAGYSQGAEVVIRTVDALPAATRKTVAVALVGDPSFRPGLASDYNLNSGTALKGIRPSLLVGQSYNMASDVAGRTEDICAASDPICAYHASEIAGLIDGSSAHYNYVNLTSGGISLVQRAANFLWSAKPTATVSPTSVQPTAPQTTPPPAQPPSAYAGGFAATVDKYATTGDSGHKGPGDQYAAGPTYAAGTTIRIYCYTNGEAITNSHYNDTTVAWDLSDDGYWYSDAWLFTNSNGTVVPACG